MTLLAIDTATSQVSVAFGRDGRVLGEVRIDGGRRHAEQLAPAIAYLATELGIDVGTLAAVAVGTGPGLYTGLRVGVTSARTMAQVLGIPIVGIPSLDLVAHPWRTTQRRVIAVLDARRREVFSAQYRPVPGGLQRDGEYTVGSPSVLAAEMLACGDDVLLVGDGALVYADSFAGLDRVELVGPAAAAPSATALVELAWERLEREEFTTPDDVVPLYLRHSDAQIAWNAP